MTRRIQKVLAVGPIRGAVDPLQRLLGEELPGLEVDAIAVVGDLGVAWSKPDTYRAVFKALGETGLPAFWIPGPIDAPISEYLRESYKFDQPLRVLLFATRPAHKGLHEPGSEVVATLIKTYAPKVAIVAGEGAAEERLATSLVVCPGRLDLGIYSVIDIHSGSVEVGELAGVTAGRTP